MIKPFSPFTVEDLQTPEGIARLNEFLSELSRAFAVNKDKYTVSNLNTDRTYDADSTSTAELADVLGTVISDLEDAEIFPK